ncbi:lipoprotein LipL21 [Leptospira venezuelensis]|uniref:lipoprotein LipL21 n=1 Tax=Leptospira venezuelensis TaxID=1958811 RepID=UPI000A38B1C8
MIKKFIAIVVTVALLTYCGSTIAQKDVNSVSKDDWSFQGWGGPPPEQGSNGKTPRDTNPKEYFYIKYSSNASIKAIAKKNPIMMQSTCRENARLQGASNITRKMISDSEPSEWITYSEYERGAVSYVLSTDCNPSVSASLFRSPKIYECKATGPGSDPNDVSKDNWEECLCIIYIKVPGGRDALIERMKEAGK